MDNNWAEVRTQLDQVLERERAHRRTRRQQPSLWQVLRQWVATAQQSISASGTARTRTSTETVA